MPRKLEVILYRCMDCTYFWTYDHTCNHPELAPEHFNKNVSPEKLETPKWCPLPECDSCGEDVVKKCRKSSK
jgi:hypothetical protein